MAEFLAMGGYAQFVWSAFGITAVVIIFNIVSARRRLKHIQRELAQRSARQSRRRSSS
jgi:heme exporter protein D